MKVLIGCLSFKEYTGSEMYVFELSKKLIELGCKVTVTSPNIGNPLVNLAESYNINVKHLSTNLSNDVYDIIHSQHRPVTSFLLNLFPNTNMVCTIHSEIYDVEYPIIHDNIKKYISIRPEIKTHLIKNFNISEEKISLIYNPIDVTKFNNEDIRDDGYTLFVGTIDNIRQKTIFDLVDYTKTENRELWLVGKNHSNYLTSILTNSHVKYFNSTYDVSKYLKNCKETAGILLGRTTIEGWLTGKPGWIYNIDSYGNIIDKKLFDVPDDTEKFNSEIVVKQIKDQYDEIIKKNELHL
jgi:glycosyltransferase involved in cell wall biosynthesis